MPNLNIGHILDNHYEIIGILGTGGMGCVYKARQIELDRMVAIKVPSEAILQNEEFLARFIREARTCARISHENIVSIYDVHSGSNPYIVMEYVDGMPLNHFLHSQATSVFVSDLLDIISQICSGLSAAHSCNVIHRDIKPANIAIANDGSRAKIMDFGIARVSSETKMTLDGSMLGTPYYMAPEQIRAQAVTPATDIYALAGIVYQIFTGRMAFEGEVTSLIYKHVSEMPPSPCILNTLLPKSASDVILRSLAKDPRKRHESAYDFAQELRRSLRPLENLPYSQIFAPATDKIQRARSQSPTQLAPTIASEDQPKPSAKKIDLTGATVLMQTDSPETELSAAPPQDQIVASETPQPTRGSHKWPVAIAVIILIILAIGAGALFVWNRLQTSPVSSPSDSLFSAPKTQTKPSLVTQSHMRWGAPLPRTEYQVGQALAVRWFEEPALPSQVYAIELTQSHKVITRKRTTVPSYYYRLDTPGDYRLKIRSETDPNASPLEQAFSVSLPLGR